MKDFVLDKATAKIVIGCDAAYFSECVWIGAESTTCDCSQSHGAWISFEELMLLIKYLNNSKNFLQSKLSVTPLNQET